MKIAMISPNRESEKAISLISLNIVKKLKSKGTNIDFITYEAGSPLSFFKSLSKLQDYDIIHVQQEYNLLGYFGLPFYLVFPVLWMLNKKIVVTMHTPIDMISLKERQNESSIKKFLKRIIYMSQNKLIDLVSDKIVVNEHFFRDVLDNDYKIKKDKIIVISQPVVEKPSLINKTKAKNILSLSGKVYLIIGNVTSDNGADIVIKQADKIGKTIIIATNPKGVNIRSNNKTSDYMDYCKDIVSKKGFENLVRFDLRGINDKLWWTYFSAADLVLQAYRSGIRSGVFSDAMAAGVPVVSSNIRFFKEMSKSYGSLKVVGKEENYSKAIISSLIPKNYGKMVKECHRYSKENSLSNIAEKYKIMYKSLLK